MKLLVSLLLAALTPESPDSREATANLKAIHVAERAYFDETGSFSEDASEVGFIPERRNRYAYYFNATGPRESRKQNGPPHESHASIIGPDQVAFPTAAFPTNPQEAGCRVTPAKGPSGELIAIGVSRKGKTGHFIIVALAVGSESSQHIDCWSVSDLDRATRSGKVARAGEPLHEQP
jgi:type IV pilus assembly protein PilA